MIQEKKIAIIGVGNLGGAILQGVLDAGLTGPGDLVACDIDESKAQEFTSRLGVRAVADPGEAPACAEILVLAVKPQDIGDCLRTLSGAVSASHSIISVAAGISTGFIESILPKGVHVVRVMPNTPALVRAGASAFCLGSQADQADETIAREIFSALGYVVRVEEDQMDAVTALSGSGPAYVFLLVEHLISAAVKNGLPQDVAEGLAVQTALGASTLLARSEENPTTLRQRVTSPGGTTEAALAVFARHGFSSTVNEALEAAVRRSKELGTQQAQESPRRRQQRPV